MTWKPSPDELADIVDRVRAGTSLVDASRRMGVTDRTLHRYMNRNPEFRAAVARARSERRPAHGIARYGGRWRCRCKTCTDANTQRIRELRLARRSRIDQAPHGSAGGFSNWGCRCGECTAAAYAKERRINAESRPGATRNGYQWTGAELDLVIRRDITAKDLAEMLGRTVAAVNMARRKAKDPKWVTACRLGNPA